MKTLNDHSMYSTTHFFVTYKITMETLRNKNYQRLSIFILEKVIKNTTLIHLLNNLSSICFQQFSCMELQQQFSFKSQLPIKSYISKFIAELNWFTEILLCKKEAYCKKLTGSPAGYSWLKQTQRHTSANLPSRSTFTFSESAK